jgi:hypothetical protein
MVKLFDRLAADMVRVKPLVGFAMFGSPLSIAQI